MAENSYWSADGDQGTIKISEDVVASIAGIAVSETDGVSGLSTGIGSDLAGLLGKKTMTSGVRVQFRGDTVLLDVSFLVLYGYPVCDVAKKAQQAVKSSIQSMTGLQVGAVNIHVQGITFPSKPDTADTGETQTSLQ